MNRCADEPLRRCGSPGWALLALSIRVGQHETNDVFHRLRDPRAPRLSDAGGFRLAFLLERVGFRARAGDAVLIKCLRFAQPIPFRLLLDGVGAGARVCHALVGAGTLPDPVVELFAESQLVATNDNWGDDAAKASAISAAAAKVGAFAWPQGSKDAALLVTLEKGSYTVVVRGVGNATGVALVEVYDVNVD